MIVPPVTPADLARLGEAGQDFQKAEILCRLAIYAYLGQAELTAVIERAPWTGFEAWDIEQNQGFACWSPECAIVSFRGTDSKSDWRQNAKALWPTRHRLGGRVHRGFNEVSSQAKGRVLEVLSLLAGDPRHLWITGHSLGGAVATDLSAELMVDGPPTVPTWEVTTFGSPRLGDRRFEERYEGRVGGDECRSHWWFVSDGDPVPHLPPKTFGYLHCGRLFWFNRSGALIPVDEREVGLQKQIEGEKAQATRRWNVLEDAMPTFQNEEEYSRFLDKLAGDIGEPAGGISLEPETGRLTSQQQSGEMQGLGEWIGKDHKLSLYLSRIRRLSSTA